MRNLSLILAIQIPCCMLLSYTDQLGRIISLTEPPKRIVSLVPSQTELLFDLGLDNYVVGVSNFCKHPFSLTRSKPKIGGTKTLDIQKIKSLTPDLIIGNKEENEQEQVMLLAEEIPVWVSDISSLNDALQMIAAIGEITQTYDKALAMIDQIEQQIQQLKGLTSPKRAAYLIWQNPYMVASTKTYISDILERMNIVNVFSESPLRYPTTTLDELKQLSTDILLLSSEPYPFAYKHVKQIQASMPNSLVTLVDGEMFSWYGSRLLQAPKYLQGLTEKLENSFSI